MKISFLALCLMIFGAGAVRAQIADGALAFAANGKTYAAKDLSPEAQKFAQTLATRTAELRARLLSEMIADFLLEREAKARGVSAEKLLDETEAKIPPPTDREILRVYEANRQTFGTQTLAQVKPQIIAFLREEPAQKAVQSLLSQLKIKHKVVFGKKDVNAADLKAADVLATIGGSRSISAREFEETNKFALTDAKLNAFDYLRRSLEESIYADLLAAEAAARNLETSDLIAREITDKMRDFSDEERDQLQSDLQKRLFAKYQVKIALDEPAPLVQQIAVAGGDPAQGNPGAPVTIVMFTDFQCPACAATHPVLQRVLTEYGDRIRFIVRDFPLESIHENAFAAACAAQAAHNQNKFFAYAEILYRNQRALDAASLKKYASEIGLDLKRFEADSANEKTAAEVRRDRADGESYGVAATPTVFIGGIKVRQNSAADFRRAIERELAKGSR